MQKAVVLTIILCSAIEACKKDEPYNQTQPPLYYCDSMTNYTIRVCAPDSLSDVDGNLYHTVRIGNQCWLKENLRTAHFRDGSSIIEIEDSASWANIYNSHSQTPAYCYPYGDSSQQVPRGKLYNWYVVNDSRGICPAGWHVATLAEWDALYAFVCNWSIYLYADSFYVSSIPQNSRWNKTGFSAYTNAFRSKDGIFYKDWSSESPSPFVSIWTASTYSDTTALFQIVDAAVPATQIREGAFPIRCIKDQ